jgi:hypothetical protein
MIKLICINDAIIKKTCIPVKCRMKLDSVKK